MSAKRPRYPSGKPVPLRISDSTMLRLQEAARRLNMPLWVCLRRISGTCVFWGLVGTLCHVTTEQRSEMDTLLDRHGGNFELVARVLQTTPDAVKTIIGEDPVLAGKWIGKQVHPVDRPPLDLPDDAVDLFEPQTMKPRDAALVTAIEAQDRKLKELDWSALGIRDWEQQDMFRKFEKFVGANIVSTLDATHGGMLAVFAKTSVLFQRISESVEAFVKPGDSGALALTSEAGQVLHQQFIDTAQLLVKLNAEATKAGHLRVMMEAKAQEFMASGKKKGGRPGFPRATPARKGGERTITVDPEK